MIHFNQHDVIFDIETEGASDIDFIRSINPPYPEFSPDAVKCGNCKTDEEKAAKVEAAMLAHDEQEKAHWQEKLDKAALSPEIGRVITIGYLPVAAPDDEAYLDDSGFDEAKLLRRFWKGYEKVVQKRGHILGWNSNGFDIPFIVKRSWILGVDVPTTIFRGRWISDTFLDLMQIWSVYEFRKFAKLDHCAKVFGIGNKSEQACTGAQFAAWYRDPMRHERAKEYGLLDLILSRKIYERLTSRRL